MNVHGVGPNPGGHPQVGANKQTTETQPAETLVTENTGRERGVIRLLQEGHFKGVADVRLRINFADELSALSESRSAAVVQADAASVLAAVDAVVDEFLATPELPEEIATGIQDLQTAFEENATTLLEQLAAAGSTDRPQIIADLQTAFENFLAGVESLLAAQEEPPAPADDTEVLLDGVAPLEPFEGEGEPPQLPQDYQTFVDALRQAFEDSLAEFTSALESAATVLPPLSEPTGNGVAYDKFLAILNEINGVAPEAEASQPPPVPDEGVDLEA